MPQRQTPQTVSEQIADLYERLRRITRDGHLHPYIPNELAYQRGDLIAAPYDNTWERLPVGADGELLLADSTETLGVRWGTAAGLTSKEYATKVVAADNTHASGKAAADYVCDGVADEVEINTALNAAGGRVLLLEGTYSIAAPITATAGRVLQGQGTSTVLQIADLTSTGRIVTSPGTFLDLHFNGAGAHVDGAAIATAFLGAASPVDIRGCVFSNWLGMSVQLDTPSTTQIIGNRWSVCDLGLKVRIVGGNIESHGHVLIANNMMVRTNTVNGGTTSWSGVDGGGIVVTDEGTPGDAGPHSVLIANNVISDMKLDGIYLRGTRYSLVTGNMLRHIGRHGIRCNDGYDYMVNGNVIRGASMETSNLYDGISLEGIGRIAVVNNMVRNSFGNQNRFGLRINIGCNNNWVTNNDLFASGATANFSDVGVGTITAAGNRV